MNYRLAYALGFHPWEDAEKMPSFSNRFAALLDDEEQGREPPFGRALDVGTGSGIWGIKLASRGWDVTGIDTVARALERARVRADAAGVDVNLVHGSVTNLSGTDTGISFRLVLDTGTFHGLNESDRAAVGQQLNERCAVDATILLLAWNPRWRGPLPRGASIAEIEAAFPGWAITDEGSTGYPPPKPLRADENWYRLRRA